MICNITLLILVIEKKNIKVLKNYYKLSCKLCMINNVLLLVLVPYSLVERLSVLYLQVYYYHDQPPYTDPSGDIDIPNGFLNTPIKCKIFHWDQRQTVFEL